MTARAGVEASHPTLERSISGISLRLVLRGSLGAMASAFIERFGNPLRKRRSRPEAACMLCAETEFRTADFGGDAQSWLSTPNVDALDR